MEDPVYWADLLKRDQENSRRRLEIADILLEACDEFVKKTKGLDEEMDQLNKEHEEFKDLMSIVF